MWYTYFFFLCARNKVIPVQGIRINAGLVWALADAWSSLRAFPSVQAVPRGQFHMTQRHSGWACKWVKQTLMWRKEEKLRPRCNDLQIIVLHLKLFLCTFARNMACMYKRNRDRQQAKPGRLWSSRFQEWDLREYVSFIPIFIPKCQPLPGKLPPSITEFDSESKRCFNSTARTRS